MFQGQTGTAINHMTPLQKLTLEILNDCMSIVEKRVSNPVYKKSISDIKVPKFISEPVGDYF